MEIKVEGVSYRVYLGRLSGSGAEVKVVDPERREHWVSFDENEVKGLFNSDGELYPAAEDLVAKWAAEQIHSQAKK